MVAVDQAETQRWKVWAQALGNGISWLSVRISGVALVAIVLINGTNVIGRYFFSAPISWAEESMLFLMVLVVFSGVAAVTWQGAHIKIELLLDHLPRELRAIAMWSSAILTSVICAVIAAESYTLISMLHAFDQRSEAMEFPVWIPQTCVLIGLVLIAILAPLRLLVFGTAASHPPHSA